MKEDNREGYCGYNYYTGTNVVNGLKECLYYIEEATPDAEMGQYHYELMNCIWDAIEKLNK